MVLHLNKHQSPSPKDALCQVWLKLAKWFWRRRFLNFVNVFSLFGNYLSLEKGGALYLNNLESPSPEDALFQVWLKLAKWFWRRRFFNFVNVFSLFRNYRRRQRRTTDKFRKEKITWAFGSGELKIRPLIEITFTQDLIFSLKGSVSNVELCCFSTNCIVWIKQLNILLRVHPHSTAF